MSQPLFQCNQSNTRQQSLLPCWDLVRSKRKSLELRVYPNGRVEVRAPLRMSQREINQFIDSRRDWINSKLLIAQNNPQSIQWQCESGATLDFQGQPLELRLIEASKSEAWIENNQLVLALAQKHTIYPQAYKQLLEHFLREQARTVFEQLIDQWFYYFEQRGHQRPLLRVKKMKTRWGSLSAKGYINLNMALVHFALPLIESVVVHELCHLQHMNHGPAFKALQTKLLPDWRERKAKLDNISKNPPAYLVGLSQ